MIWLQVQTHKNCSMNCESFSVKACRLVVIICVLHISQRSSWSSWRAQTSQSSWPSPITLLQNEIQGRSWPLGRCCVNLSQIWWNVKTLLFYPSFSHEYLSCSLSYLRINAIKEVAARCPLSMSEDLLQDLTQYKSHKDKSMWFIVIYHGLFIGCYLLWMNMRIDSLTFLWILSVFIFQMLWCLPEVLSSSSEISIQRCYTEKTGWEA